MLCCISCSNLWNFRPVFLSMPLLDRSRGALWVEGPKTRKIICYHVNNWQFLLCKRCAVKHDLWNRSVPATRMSMSTLYAPLGSLFQAQGENCETTSYIHQRLQNSKKWGRFERQHSTSIAKISHEGKFFQRQQFVIKVSEKYFGRPLRLCPCGCQAKTVLIQRCPGSVAKYWAKLIQIVVSQTNFRPWFGSSLRGKGPNTLIPDVKNFMPW